MDKKIALQWARALESGEYKQAQGSLREGDSFCCLGVLCNLHAQAHPEIAMNEHLPNMYMDHDMDLPSEVVHWAGMYTEEGKFNVQLNRVYGETIKDQHGDPVHSLVDMNDTLGYDFKKIAKAIRKHYAML